MTQLVDVSVKVPKELNDVRVALVDLLSALKTGGGLPAVLSHLNSLMTALDGIDKVPSEVKEELSKSLDVMALMASELIGVLLAPTK